MAKILVLTGIILIVLGLCWPVLGKMPLGRLPGDILIQKKNVSFYFPLVTSILVSIFLSLLLFFLSRR